MPANSMIQSTSDGKLYHMLTYTCGKQNTAGICDHIKNPVYVEQFPPQFTITPVIQPIVY